MNSPEAGFPPLATLYIYLMGSCNLNCRHCWITPDFHPGGPGPSPELTLSKILDFVDRARPLGLGRVKLTGGEPLLFPDFVPLVEGLAQRGLFLDIETNATLIGADLAGLIAANFGCVSISLDAAEPRLHDAIRGVAGAFERTTRAIGLLGAQGANVQLIMALDRENMGQVRPLAVLAARLGAASLKINPIVPCGRAENLFAQSEGLGPVELMALERELAQDPPAPGLTLEFDLPPALKSLAAIKAGSLANCHIHTILGLLSDGSLSLCGIGQVHPELVLGRMEDDLESLWQGGSPLLNWLRDGLAEKLEGVCGLCLFRHTCLGACRANAYAVSGSLGAPYYLCQQAYEQGLFPASRHV